MCKKIDDLVFTFCSSQSHQGSNFQGSGSHDRKNWSHVSSSYSNVLFIRLSISFVLCLTMPTLPFARSGYMSTLSRKLCSEQLQVTNLSPCSETVFEPRPQTLHRARSVCNISLYFWALCVSNFYQF